LAKLDMGAVSISVAAATAALGDFQEAFRAFEGRLCDAGFDHPMPR